MSKVIPTHDKHEHPEASSQAASGFAGFFDQDTKQRMQLFSAVCIELYRVIVASLLIVFTPQNCGGHACTAKENMAVDDETLPTAFRKGFYVTGLAVNYITLLAFCGLYATEILRENALIRHLDVDAAAPGDEVSVTAVMKQLDKAHVRELRRYQWAYSQMSTVTLTLFVINVIVSGIIVIGWYSDGNITSSTFATNVLFMAGKIALVISNTSVPQNIFYSSFLHSQVQYNTRDPDAPARSSVKTRKHLSAETNTSSSSVAATEAEAQSSAPA